VKKLLAAAVIFAVALMKSVGAMSIFPIEHLQSNVFQMVPAIQGKLTAGVDS